MTVSVVIPNWNGVEVVEACLESLARQSHQPHEVIVIDNGSSDGSVNLITTKFPKTKLVQLETNTGFAYAVNRGIEEARGEYVVLLNNDAKADPKMIEHLLVTAKSSKAAIIGAILVSVDGGEIDTAGEYLSSWGIPGPTLRGQPVSSISKHDHEILAACGGAAMYDKKLFDKIGLFDEKYFAYNEDVDISLRTRFAGERVFLSVAARAFHDTGHTEKKIPGLARKQTIKNTMILDLKIFPGLSLLKYSPKIIARQILLQGSAIVHGFWLMPLQADWEVLRLLPKILSDREAIQKDRQISRKAFESLLVHKSGVRD